MKATSKSRSHNSELKTRLNRSEPDHCALTGRGPGPGDGRVSAPDPGTGHVCTAIPPQCGGMLSQDVFLKIFSILEKGKFK